MQVREQEIYPADGPGERRPEAADTGPRVEHQDRAICAPDFHTRRVPAIAFGLGPWRRQRPARAP